MAHGGELRGRASSSSSSSSPPPPPPQRACPRPPCTRYLAAYAAYAAAYVHVVEGHGAERQTASRAASGRSVVRRPRWHGAPTRSGNRTPLALPRRRRRLARVWRRRQKTLLCPSRFRSQQRDAAGKHELQHCCWALQRRRGAALGAGEEARETQRSESQRAATTKNLERRKPEEQPAPPAAAPACGWAPTQPLASGRLNFGGLPR